MIAKSFKTYVFSGNLGLSLGEVHCSLRKLAFHQGIIMSPKRSLSCPEEQRKFFFPLGTNMSPEEKEHFFLMNLGPSPRKIHCSSKKLYFSPWNLLGTSI
jgi:hypothetical protein